MERRTGASLWLGRSTIEHFFFVFFCFHFPFLQVAILREDTESLEKTNLRRRSLWHPSPYPSFFFLISIPVFFGCCSCSADLREGRGGSRESARRGQQPAFSGVGSRSEDRCWRDSWLQDSWTDLRFLSLVQGGLHRGIEQLQRSSKRRPFSSLQTRQWFAAYFLFSYSKAVPFPPIQSIFPRLC